MELGEKLRLKLQGCILGHVTRQQLVQNVRREYERLVDEVRAVEGRELVPLANETIVWPRETTLCLPQFITPGHSNESRSVLHSNATDVTPSPSIIQPHPPHQTTIELPHTGSPTDHPPHTEDTPTDHPPHTYTEDTLQVTSHSSVDVFPELPKSREGLKELRAQLSMELLWIKQAIASRQNYLLYKQQLTSNSSQ